MAREAVKGIEVVEEKKQPDQQEGENVVMKPTEEQGGTKGFKYQKNQYGHFGIVWEDGKTDVPAELSGHYTTLQKAKTAVQNYFDSRRAPREVNPVVAEMIKA